MPKKYLDFTPKRLHSPQMSNIPVFLHDDTLPRKGAEIEGLRMQGVVVDFKDPEVPERIHKALHAGKLITRAGLPLDCLWFAVLMDDPDLAGSLATDKYKVVCRTGERPVDPRDTTQEHMVRVGRGFLDQEFRFVHSAVPVHTAEALYIHKLGSSGPLCLSGLQAAVDCVNGSAAFPVVSYTLEEK